MLNALIGLAAIFIIGALAAFVVKKGWWFPLAWWSSSATSSGSFRSPAELRRAIGPSRMTEIVISMYESEFRPTLPELPTFKWMTRWEAEQWAGDRAWAAHRLNQADQVFDFYREVTKYLNRVYEGAFPNDANGLFKVRLIERVPNVGLLIADFIAPFYGDFATRLSLLGWPHATYWENIQMVSRRTLSATALKEDKIVSPHEHPGPPQQIIQDYLSNTPFEHLFDDAWTSVAIPEDLRPEHGVIIASPGAGKTQLLEYLIFDSLDNPTSPAIIVIDSKNDMAKRIPKLPQFHPDHGKDRDNIIIINPHEKPALNVFDFPGEITQQRITQIFDSMKYFFGSLLGSELSATMDVVFLPLLHVIVRVKGATLADFRELVRNPLRYPDVLQLIDPRMRSYILSELVPSGKIDPRRATKDALVSRLQGIIGRFELDDMFSGTHNSVDLEDIMRKGKILVINTDIGWLGPELSAIFGKYWISRILDAGRARGSGAGTGRRQVHIYLDETEPYVDDKIKDIYTTLRSYDVCMMSAFQNTGQMGAYVRSIRDMSATKFVSSPDQQDLAAAADFMDVTPEFLRAQVKESRTGPGKFAFHYRGMAKALSVTFPFLSRDKTFMSETDYQRLLAWNASKLQSRPRTTQQVPPPEEPPAASSAPPPPEPPPRPPSPTPFFIGRTVEAEYEVVDEAIPRPPAPRRLSQSDDLPEVPQPKKRRRRPKKPT